LETVKKTDTDRGGQLGETVKTDAYTEIDREYEEFRSPEFRGQ
jgi:hypothetical protein